MVEYRTHPLNQGGSPALRDRLGRGLPPPRTDAPHDPDLAVTMNGIPGAAIRGDTPSRTALLYIHGGGFTGGSAWADVDFLRITREVLCTDSYAVDYTLAPAKKYPCQLKECQAFYEGLLAYGHQQVVVTGDSAGGNLAVALTLRLMAQGLPRPAAVVSMSGLLDFSCDKGDDFLQKDLPAMLKAYAYESNVLLPGLSPVYADLTGFPPLLLQAGSAESFQYHMERIALRASKSDCPCVASLWEGLEHDFTMEFGQYPEATAALAEVLDFLQPLV